MILGKDYIIEALNFHLLKSEQPGTIPKTIRTKPRQPVGLPKVSFPSDPSCPIDFHSFFFFLIYLYL